MTRPPPHGRKRPRDAKRTATETPRTLTESPATEASAALRRVPRQARGQARIERILDAADELFAAHGIEAVSTNLIAERAGTAVGGVYHYFPNRDAIIHALAARHLTALRALYAERMGEPALTLTIDALVPHIIAPVAELSTRIPGYLAVYDALRRGAAHSPEAAAARTAIIDAAAAMVRARVPSLRPAEAALRAEVVLDVVHALLDTAARADVPMRRKLHRELVRVVRLYAMDVEREQYARR
jgi:AcrR family transcriptional regulator